MNKKEINQECILFFKEKIEQLQKIGEKESQTAPNLAEEYACILHRLMALHNEFCSTDITAQIYIAAIGYYSFKEEAFDEEDVLMDFIQRIVFEKDYQLLYRIYKEKFNLIPPDKIYALIKENKDIDTNIIDKYKDLFIIYHSLYRFDFALDEIFETNSFSSILGERDFKTAKKQINNWIRMLEHEADEDKTFEDFTNVLTTYMQFQYCIVYEKEYIPAYLKLV